MRRDGGSKRSAIWTRAPRLKSPTRVTALTLSLLASCVPMETIDLSALDPAVPAHLTTVYGEGTDLPRDVRVEQFTAEVRIAVLAYAAQEL